MKHDFHQPHCPVDPVLELSGLHLAATPPYDTGLAGLDLVVRRGELVVVLLEEGMWRHPLADVVSGLLPPDAGAVRIFGSGWDGLSPDVQAVSRWKIGRVFEGNGWVSNLDVDENITLSERHHTRRPLAEIEDEMQRLAGVAGLDGIPPGRPAAVSRERLQRCEWVRSMMGQPWLVLLERPGQDLSPGWRTGCGGLVAQARARGAAVIWLCEDAAEWNDKSLNPTLKLRAEGNTLRVETP